VSVCADARSDLPGSVRSARGGDGAPEPCLEIRLLPAARVVGGAQICC
jgi:hypothetical protein